MKLVDRLRTHMKDYGAAVEAADRIEALEAECFALAANQCRAGYGDDYGNHRCKRIEALEAALRGLADAVRTDVGAGYGWGAWLPEEYTGAERALKMVADRARAALAPEQDT